MDRETLARMFASGSTEYGTPQISYNFLNTLFRFTLDVCATADNAKVKRYFTVEDDGLEQDWSGIAFCNPPYTKGEKACVSNCKKKTCIKRKFHIHEDIPSIGDWINKAHGEVVKGHCKTVVCVLPARVDTKWFQVVWSEASGVCFVRGRWQFEGAKDPALFPVALVVFGEVTEKQLGALSQFGNVLDLENGDIYVF